MSQKSSDADLPALEGAGGEPPRPNPAEERADEVQLGLPGRSLLRDLIWATPSWLLSMVLHVILLLVMAMVYFPTAASDEDRDLLLASGEEEVLEELENFDDEPLETLDVATDGLVLDSAVEPTDVQMSTMDEPAASVQVDLSDFGLAQAPASDLIATVGGVSGGALSGRGEGREKLVRRDGGSDASEQSVSLALDWLAKHQMPDGGWCFDHTLSPACRGQCRNPGTVAEARNAATAMAVLPFLGAGQTHREGKYKKVVNGGLYYLITHMKVSPKGGSLYEKGGRLYSHGLASIVLCEAYAMTRDKGLYAPAQQAVNYIVYSQDPVGGGWRYEEQQPGDTSVVGWQIMALKSAYMAYLQIPGETIRKASLFLDTVQAKNGARYGYTTPGDKPSTTSIGLLCRMHLGWTHDNPALVEGVKFLSEQGPSAGDMYYNYYATQVMRHYEGDYWKKWNSVMRDQLIKSQATKGHETGSWHFDSSHGSKGGRLYSTSMATMILEVYYRHLPIYRKQSTEAEFPLD